MSNNRSKRLTGTGLPIQRMTGEFVVMFKSVRNFDVAGVDWFLKPIKRHKVLLTNTEDAGRPKRKHNNVSQFGHQPSTISKM